MAKCNPNRAWWFVHSWPLKHECFLLEHVSCYLREFTSSLYYKDDWQFKVHVVVERSGFYVHNDLSQLSGNVRKVYRSMACFWVKKNPAKIFLWWRIEPSDILIAEHQENTILGSCWKTTVKSHELNHKLWWHHGTDHHCDELLICSVSVLFNRIVCSLLSCWDLDEKISKTTISSRLA